jgi:ATP-dependent Clp protease ATP-binding subunit ClpC
MRARRLPAAEREARALGHRAVATEHLLLGLLRVDESVAARALRRWT